MIQCQRVSAGSKDEIWFLYAVAARLYKLGEVHCQFDHTSKGAIIKVFVAENCPRHRDLIDYFIDQTIPQEYEFMVEVFSRGFAVDSWNNLEVSEPTDKEHFFSEMIAYAATKPRLA